MTLPTEASGPISRGPAEAVAPARPAGISKAHGDWRIARLLAATAFGLVLAWLAVRAALVLNAAWLGANDLESLEILAHRLPANTAYNHMLARVELAGGHPKVAAGRLEGALRKNPLPPSMWLDLARARVALGKSQRAAEAASIARRRNPTSAAVCYDAAVVLFQAGAADHALAALRCAADLAPDRSGEVYDLAWAVVGDGEVVRRAVVPDTASGWRNYFGYVRGRRYEDVSPAWAGLARHGSTPEDRLQYVESLIGLGHGAEAREVWAETYGGPGGNLVFNGSFEADSVGRGLDWVIRPCEGARTAVVATEEALDGKRVLEVAFDGSNVQYHQASQVVPVQGGRPYRLQAWVRSDAVTSLSGPRLTVRGSNGCDMGSVDGREWGGTNPWSEEALYFTAPPGCSAVIVEIRRDRTDRFDRDISGRIWIDRVELTAVGGASVIVGRQAVIMERIGGALQIARLSHEIPRWGS